jgi:Predicted Fe-S oxidoreductases
MAQTVNTERHSRLLPAPSSFEEGVVKFGDKEIKIGGPLPTLAKYEKLVRVTHSLCPACYRLLPATIFEKEGKLFIRKYAQNMENLRTYITEILVYTISSTTGSMKEKDLKSPMST